MSKVYDLTNFSTEKELLEYLQARYSMLIKASEFFSHPSFPPAEGYHPLLDTLHKQVKSITEPDLRPNPPFLRR